MSDFLYRFRSTDKLLGTEYQELEKQEIYFSPFKDLNDPMEGFKNMFWKGDAIAWKNLLRHYLLCLQIPCLLWAFGDNKDQIVEDQISAIQQSSDLPEAIKKSYDEICNLFFKNDTIQKFIMWLAERQNPIRPGELIFYIKSLHAYAISIILEIFETEITGNQKSKSSSLKTNIFASLESLMRLPEDSLEVSEMFDEAHSYILIQQDLMFHYKNSLNNSASIQTVSQNKAFVINDFPEKYIQQLEKLLYPGSYVACFMSKCTNASVWGHYGNNHKGVCLKFKTNKAQGYLSLDLTGFIGSRSNKGTTNREILYGIRSHRFNKVNYKNKYPEIDFFRSLGMLNHPTLSESWYLDENKNISICAVDIFNNEKKWQKKYWDRLIKVNTTKLKDWLYEQEYRLILDDMLSYYANDIALRKLKYNFSSLEGIIFGIKTPIEDKIKIMKIIGEKCKREPRQEEFKFYQAFYSRKKGVIEYVPLSLIKYK